MAQRRGRRARPPGHQRRPPGPGSPNPPNLEHRRPPAGLNREGPPRAWALGIFQAATAGGATAGIVLGGLLTSYIGWRAIFLVNPPIIAVLAMALPRLLPRDAGQGRARLDVAGAALVTLSVTSLIYGLSEGEDHGFTAPPAVAASPGGCSHSWASNGCCCSA